MDIKIIEEATPKRAEYEVNNYIAHCEDNGIEILEVTSHVNADAVGNYCYTFIIKTKED